MRARHGKIARLPREIREEINLRLERAEPGPGLLAWLNALPEVQKMAQEDFGGEPISPQNLSQWRQGGFQDWLALQNLWDGVRNLNDFAEAVEAGTEARMADRLATVMLARLAALLTRWNGEQNADFEARARTLNGLCRSVVSLQKAARGAEQANADREKALREQRQEEKKAMQEEHLLQVFNALSAPRLAKILGKGPEAEKLARHIMAVRGGRLDEAAAAQPVKVNQSDAAPAAEPKGE